MSDSDLTGQQADHGELADLTELARAHEAHEEWEREEEQARRDAVMNRQPFYGLQIDPDIDFYPDVADREPGDRNIVKGGFDIHPQVTFIAAGFLILFIGFTLIFENTAKDAFNETLGYINGNFGWFYILSANAFVLAAAYFAFSRYGKIRIGGPTAKPEFSTPSWYAMLISAGMGIGLMFWSVAEPISHWGSPPPLFGTEAESSLAGKYALITTYYHWGIHPWAIYGLVSLALAFFAYNRGLPLTFRSVFYPILGKKIYGPWGHFIDILTVLATLFGLATSLGLGVGQAAAGLNYLFDWPTNKGFQVLLIAIITGIATISVVAGLDAGVKRLSQINIWLAILLMAFVFIAGPTLFILSSFAGGVGGYFQWLPELAFWNEGFTTGPDGSGTNWQGGWTVFYWGWWISWSPFVGMFIARISKGRSVRELILGVVMFPSLLSFLWMAVFGGSALRVQLEGTRDIAGAVSDDVSTAMFEMFTAFPLTDLISVIGIVLVISFFVTSSDSGSLVVDHLTSGGKLDSPKPQRVFWAIMEGAIAAVLLAAGGLGALQTAAVSSGLPFAAVLLVMCWSLRKAFDEELDLLEDHYDLEQFRSRHRGLMERLGL